MARGQQSQQARAPFPQRLRQCSRNPGGPPQYHDGYIWAGMEGLRSFGEAWRGCERAGKTRSRGSLTAYFPPSVPAQVAARAAPSASQKTIPHLGT